MIDKIWIHQTAQGLSEKSEVRDAALQDLETSLTALNNTKTTSRTGREREEGLRAGPQDSQRTVTRLQEPVKTTASTTEHPESNLRAYQALPDISNHQGSTAVCRTILQGTPTGGLHLWHHHEKISHRILLHWDQDRSGTSKGETLRNSGSAVINKISDDRPSQRICKSRPNSSSTSFRRPEPTHCTSSDRLRPKMGYQGSTEARR